jgi:dUTPase
MSNLVDLIDKNSLEVGLKILARNIDLLLKANDIVPKIVYEKLHADAKAPEKAFKDDACYDIYAVSDPIIESTRVVYHTGLRFKIPPGYSIDIYPRSSVSKTDLFLANSVGIVDTGYRGEFIIAFKLSTSLPKIYEMNICEDPNQPLLFMVAEEYTSQVKEQRTLQSLLYKKGDKIAQFRLVKKIDSELEEGTVDTETERSDKGWGSSGK